MEFIVQHNLMNEASLLKVKEAVAPYPHRFVGVNPFSHEITSDEPLEGTNYIGYGSTLLTTLASKLGWKGMSFDLEQFNYRASLANRDDMLNSNVITVREAIEFLNNQLVDMDYFTRPSADLKQYSGQVMMGSELVAWLEDAIQYDSSNSYGMSLDMDIVVCEPKPILMESRFFIVDRKVVSGSIYRHAGQLHQERIDPNSEMGIEAQQFADKWLPADNCVMDLALVDEGSERVVKVIEFNCINSSGFYDHDVPAIFNALWAYYNR